MAFNTKKFDFLAPDYSEVQVTLSGTVVAGDLVTLNDVNGFYAGGGVDGDQVTVITKCRKTKVAKTTGTAWTVGDTAYYVNSTGKVALAGDIVVGTIAAAAASADTEGMIDFDGTMAGILAAALVAAVAADA